LGEDGVFLAGDFLAFALAGDFLVPAFFAGALVFLAAAFFTGDAVVGLTSFSEASAGLLGEADRDLAGEDAFLAGVFAFAGAFFFATLALGVFLTPAGARLAGVFFLAGDFLGDAGTLTGVGSEELTDDAKAADTMSL
jgi:hypothetical protein